MRNILVLPIDDRPCHNDLVQEAVASIESVTLDFVPKHLLGHFMHAGDCEGVIAYLEKHVEHSDTLIVAIDALLYGGLVQARTIDSTKTLEHYQVLLARLEGLKQINPNLTILAYSVIIRLTTTVSNSDRLQAWEDIFEYSQLAYQETLTPEQSERLECLLAAISPADLHDYQQARLRNHHFNDRCLALVEAGVIDYLVLAQEDAHPQGPHVAEQQALLLTIEKRNLKNKVTIKNGTDEMVALLLARALNQDKRNFNLDVQNVAQDYVAKFEDQTLIQNIMSAFVVANLKPTSEEVDTVFLALPAQGPCIDLAFETLPHHNRLTLKEAMRYHHHDGKNILVLDAQYGNGGDIRDLEMLMHVLPHATLCGYSAWNTGSNAIGTLVLDLIIALYYPINQRYLRLRLIDDALYQSQVRKAVNQAMIQKGLDVWAENYSDAINQLLTQMLNDSCQKHPLLRGSHISAWLPWGRSFEVLLKESTHEKI